jgi:hypothetical protein
MVDVNQNITVEILKNHKNSLIAENELLNEQVQMCNERLNKAKVKINENIRKANEIDKAIIKLKKE